MQIPSDQRPVSAAPFSLVAKAPARSIKSRIISGWKRTKQSLLDILQQNITAEKLALSFALGFSIGLFPVLGVTFLINGVIGIVFKLNQPALQFTNFITTPVQIACFLPHLRIGQFIFAMLITPSATGESSHGEIDFSVIVSTLQTNSFGALSEFGSVLFKAIVGWTIFLPFVTAAMYGSLLPLLRFMLTNMRNKSSRMHQS